MHPLPSENHDLYLITIKTSNLTTKTKVIAFKGKYPILHKIILSNSITEQVSHFNYLGCNISYEANYDVNIIINEYVGLLNTKTTSKERHKVEIA
jgi:hypothetical protein